MVAKPKLKKFKKSFSDKRVVVIFALLFAIIGTILLTNSFAATPTAQFEVENATLTSNASTIQDATASGGSAVRFNAPPASGENTFTLAAIPDTQVETSGASSTQQRYIPRLQWLIDNKTSLNLKYVWQVGDLQDWDDATHSHYVRASDGLKLLEQANIPYGLTVGNHDTNAVCSGGSACPGADTPLEFRRINTWHMFYPPSRYTGLTTLCSEFATHNTRLMASAPAGMSTTNHNHPQYMKNACAAQNTTDNAFRTFNAGGLKWLIINYEMWPRAAAQEWMKIVIERHPDHNVILFTHMHLDGSGNMPNDFGGYGSPQGTPQMVFNNVISKYSNVKIVSSGHTSTSACKTHTGTAGNSIYSYLNNRYNVSPAPNHVRLLKFNISAKTITSETVSPNGVIPSNPADCAVSNVQWVQPN